MCALAAHAWTINLRKGILTNITTSQQEACKQRHGPLSFLAKSTRGSSKTLLKIQASLYTRLWESNRVQHEAGYALPMFVTCIKESRRQEQPNQAQNAKQFDEDFLLSWEHELTFARLQKQDSQLELYMWSLQPAAPTTRLALLYSSGIYWRLCTWGSLCLQPDMQASAWQWARHADMITDHSPDTYLQNSKLKLPSTLVWIIAQMRDQMEI